MTHVEAERVPTGRWSGDHLGETRWVLEAARLAVDPVWHGRGGIPRGERARRGARPRLRGRRLHPRGARGLAAADRLPPRGLRVRRHLDCSERGLERVERQVAELHGRSQRRVAIIGHSRGGHFARAVAARQPEVVSHAVSLGADLQAMFPCSALILAAVEGTRRTLHKMGRARREECLTYRCRCAFADGFWAPFPDDRVRLTSIYSKGDGVVRWQAQLVPYAECVEVTGSHVGLVFNRKSYRAIAQAQAAPDLAPGLPKRPVASLV